MPTLENQSASFPLLDSEKEQEVSTQPISPSDKSHVQANQAVVQYPLLEALLTQKAQPLRGVWTLRDVAKIFDVSVRTIQDWIREGKLISRNLPGRGKCLSGDLEAFLQNSVRRAGRGGKED